MESEEVDGSFEDPGVGLHDADIAGVHDTLDLYPNARTHLTELELGEALGHQSVGIGDDPESDPGVGQGLQALTACGYGLDPQRCVGELAVDMEVSLLAPVRRHTALDNVGLEVVKPCLGPVRFDVDMGPESHCGSVVRVNQHLSSHRALGPGKGPQDPIGVREDEDAACIKEYRGGRVVARGHTEKVHSHRVYRCSCICNIPQSARGGTCAELPLRHLNAPRAKSE